MNALHGGVRAHAFFNQDHYVKDGDAHALVGSVTFEHKYVNAGYDYLRATDQLSALRPEADANGYSIWAPRDLPERLGAVAPLRSLEAQRAPRQPRFRTRTIVGVGVLVPAAEPGVVGVAVRLRRRDLC
jgi:hypothetical protein